MIVLARPHPHLIYIRNYTHSRFPACLDAIGRAQGVGRGGVEVWFGDEAPLSESWYQTVDANEDPSEVIRSNSRDQASSYNWCW